jgi:hypothetical protein
MNITKDTTDEAILAGVNAARARLAEEAMDDTKGLEQLADAVHHVAAQVGVASVHHELRNALQWEASPEQIRKNLTKLVLVGADDKWSGRGNEVRRAKFDAARQEVSDVLDRIDRGEFDKR